VASASATHAVTRRRLLAGTLATASAALAGAAVPADALPAPVIEPDAELIWRLTLCPHRGRRTGKTTPGFNPYFIRECARTYPRRSEALPPVSIPSS
jgi:hypothetical protein